MVFNTCIMVATKGRKMMITTEDIEQAKRDWKPRDGSGKTKYNRNKNKGESWTELRDKARGNK